MKLLACTHIRHAPNPHSCGNGGGLEIVTQLADAVRIAGLDVIVEQTACMGMCVNGPTVRLLPDGKNWHRVDMQKIGEILEFVKQLPL